MPVKKAAIKDLRQSKKKQVANLRVRRQLKDLAKSIEKALTDNQIDKVKELAISFQKSIDKAIKHGQLKKNTGARKKSRLAKQIKDKTSKK